MNKMLFTATVPSPDYTDEIGRLDLERLIVNAAVVMALVLMVAVVMKGMI